jgi:acylphosphatase
VLISGLVQGVFFRQSTRQLAERLGLTGWVRNRSDGRVEAVFQGPPARVAEIERWCCQGPPGARVREIESQDEPIEPALGRFEVRPTA